jgi:uracil phosphoribosyltransferase
LSKIVLKASDLDGYLTENDKKTLETMNTYYAKALDVFDILSRSQSETRLQAEKQRIIEIYDAMGKLMQEIVKDVPSVQVYSFSTPRESHPEVSRLIAKLRDSRTEHSEFVYYIQRAYEFSSTLPSDPTSRRRKTTSSQKPP